MPVPVSADGEDEPVTGESGDDEGGPVVSGIEGLVVRVIVTDELRWIVLLPVPPVPVPVPVLPAVPYGYG